MSTKKVVAHYGRGRIPNPASGMSIPLVSLALTVVINVLSVGYIYGSFSVRMSNVEDTLKSHQSELRVVSDVKQDIAVAKTRLESINVTLEEMKVILRSRGR